jgi:hypothetical protein
MRKDYILTSEEKQSKKQRLEENRLLRSSSINIKSECIKEHHESVRNIFKFILLSIRIFFSLLTFLQLFLRL